MFISLRITVGMCNVYLTEIYCNIDMVYSITDTSKSLFFCKYELFFYSEGPRRCSRPVPIRLFKISGAGKMNFIQSNTDLQNWSIKYKCFFTVYSYTVPKEIDFPRFNMKCRGENVILRGIFHVASFHVISRKF